MSNIRSRPDDGSEDVAEFLARIKDLGSKREDEEKGQSVEEQILAGRKEREARRAERARSISPAKDSPSTTPLRQSVGLSTPRSSATSFTPTPSTAMATAEIRKSVDIVPSNQHTPKTLSINLDLEPSRPSSPAASTLSRQGTLSWQQRPSSRDAGSRPTSLLALDRKSTLSPRASPAPEPAVKEMSRADVAKSLEGRDPAWFRQTADRGIGSAAYRKSQENEEPVSGNNVQLPGMGGKADMSTKEANLSAMSRQQPHKHGIEATNRISTTMPPPASSRSPLPLFSAQKFEPPSDTEAARDVSPNRRLAMSPAQRGISPERPVSPTKGLGGFVESAMLRRSDSLNKHKRAGSQAGSSLSRGNSITGSQRDSGLGSLKGTTTMGEEVPARTADADVPISPTKIVDSKRWSPTKQSWLEGAITKTESSRPKSGSLQSSPMWLSELQKSKDTAAAPTEKTTSHKPVQVGGLLRSSQDITKSATSPRMDLDIGRDNKNEMSAKAKLNSPSVPSETSDLSSRHEQNGNTGPVEFSQKLVGSADSSSNLLGDAASSSVTSANAPPLNTVKPSTLKMHTAKLQERGSQETKPAETKIKPQPPAKTDFRAGLKGVKNTDDKSKNEELEFKNVFGKLKKAETKNYVAPDELKENIMRGKGGLNITGGPRVYQKKDEFKDSILKKKEEMKAGVSVKAKSPEPPAKTVVPEAIARRQMLAQKSSPETTSEKPRPNLESKPILSRTKSATESASLSSTIVAKPETGPKPDRKTFREETPDLSKSKASPIKQTSVEMEPKPIALEKKTSAPAQLQGLGISNKFADRFNPALAGILARGPSPMTGVAVAPPRTASPTNIEESSEHPTSSSSSQQLTHATKGRAKGPKRRAPGAAKAETNSPATKPEAAKTLPIGSYAPSNEIQKPQKSPTDPLPIRERNTEASKDASVVAAKSPPSVKPKHFTQSTPHIDHIPSSPAIPKPLSPKISKFKPPVSPKSPEVNLITEDVTAKSPKSPPTSGNKAKALSRISSNGTAADSLHVPVPGGTLNDFFDNLSLPKINTDVDVQALLTDDRQPEPSYRTVWKGIWEVTGGGKKTKLGPVQEYTLVEDRMYLCKHHLETSDLKQIAEVYLWYGDSVSPTSVEDALLFCRSEAKEAGCRLEVLKQGKETQSFLNALGGIMITRRSNSSRYMLCGRRHLGQIVFDEVDYLAESLCSGFTYILAVSEGGLFLWKGKGAHADELACARLMSMDLSTTGDIQEVEEGSEPASLRRILDLTRRTVLPLWWSQKGSMERYATRLFSVNADFRPRSNSSLSNFAANVWKRRPSWQSLSDASEGSITEIKPFAQTDLAEDGIFVLDAFFEIFVVVGSQTRSNFNSFVLALTFAQEYGMLSVSVQDRPSIPKSHVLFLGAQGTLPFGFRVSFRKLDDRVLKQQNSWSPTNVTMPLIDALHALEGLESTS